jgi:hypothetical protein
MSLGRTAPILRIFDEAKAKESWGNDMSIADPFGNRLIFTDLKSP